ncbi:hypothetical protein C8R44DRAFT_789572 [Mycena epipterygia]|nr:hypothetical protein C8R44DRAFT_789572 [Mycena epipterygia]
MWRERTRAHRFCVWKSKRKKHGPPGTTSADPSPSTLCCGPRYASAPTQGTSASSSVGFKARCRKATLRPTNSSSIGSTTPKWVMGSPTSHWKFDSRRSPSTTPNQLIL